MADTIGPNTNITEQARDAFQALVSGKYCNFAILSCFFDGEPTSAIVTVNKEGEEYQVLPLFVAVTDKMKDKLTDHDGRVPTEMGGSDAG